MSSERHKGVVEQHQRIVGKTQERCWMTRRCCS